MLRVPGLIDALDWLDQHSERHNGLWDRIGQPLRRRPAALIDRLRELIANDLACRDLWRDIDGALHELAEEIRRRLLDDDDAS